MSSNDLQQIRNSSASYYIIGSYTLRHVSGSSRVWCERLKVITLPRHLVVQRQRPSPIGRHLPSRLYPTHLHVAFRLHAFRKTVTIYSQIYTFLFRDANICCKCAILGVFL
ncbi:hypothetical protein [Hallella sp.]|uniref:hypothetical protein n=1 Tax=Hallella sp. TaxID=2980186 RepID=UPI00307A8689